VLLRKEYWTKSEIGSSAFDFEHLDNKMENPEGSREVLRNYGTLQYSYVIQ
jgi:hypothetical protein